MTTQPYLFNTLRLKTLSPIHIGDGRKLKPIDWVLDGKWLCVLDENKVIAWLAQDIKRAEHFSNAVVKGNVQGMDTLLGKLGADWRQFVAYRIARHTQKPPRDVLTFIKTGDFQPYLPGSSLKGSLRSALLRGMTIEDNHKQEQFATMVLNADEKSPSLDIEALVFTASGRRDEKSSNYDVNRLIHLRDVYSLSIQDLRVVETKVISTIGGDGLQAKPYSIFVEALAPNTQVDLEVEWQAFLLDELASRLHYDRLVKSFIYLPEYCRAAALNIMQQEIDFYNRHGESGLADWFQRKFSNYSQRTDLVFPLPLGWGSGYDPKTITDLLGDKAFRKVVDNYNKGLGKPGRNPSAKWLGTSDSPKSRKVVKHYEGGNVTYEPLGWVEISFLPLNGQDWLGQQRAVVAEPPIFPVKMAQSLGEHPHPAPQAPQAKSTFGPQKKPPFEQNIEPPLPKQIVQTFETLPKPGDLFYGVVFEVTASEILLEIPGLDADNQAYATLRIQDNLLLGRRKEYEKILCEVIELKEESKGYWQVRCRLG